MSDAKLIGGSGGCDDGGEHGERGHRGHRGRQGPTGPAGPGGGTVVTDEVNILGDGSPGDIVRLSTFQPFAVTSHTIYARPGGSDTTGDGSIGNPFATFQHAIMFVPTLIPAGQSYVVDITGIGVETLPENYQFPIIQGTFYLGVPSPVPFLFDHALTIRAFPQLVATVPPTDAVITDADLYTRAADPDTNLVTITVPGVRASWAANGLKGKQLIRTGGPNASQTSSAIYASDDNGGVGPSTLSIANRIGVVPAILGAGVEFQIVEPSATLEAPPATTTDGASVECANVSSIVLQGIRVRCTVPGGSSFGGLLFADCGQPYVELGDFPDGIYATGAALQFAVFSSIVGGPGFSPTGALDNTFMPRRSLFLNIADWITTCDAIDSFNSVFDGCADFGNTAINPTQGPIGSGPYPIQGFSMENCLVTGSTGNGIHAQGGKFSLEFVQINGSAGDGINVEKGTNYVTLHHVTGTGNGAPGVNVGVRANDGAQVQATDASTTIEGGGAADQVQCGSLAIGTWVSAGAGNQFDLPPTAASINVATGSRIFIRA